jgi:CRISPR-associated protein Cmr4
MTQYLMWITTESGVHAGADESIGTIDEPIQRRVTTGAPVIHGQSLKGAERRVYRAALASSAPGLALPPTETVFGDDPPTSASSGPPSPGSLSVGEAVTVGFPVPAFRRRFRWVTCPSAIAEVMRYMDMAGIDTAAAKLSRFGPLDEEKAGVCSGGGWPTGGRVDLGDFTLSVDPALTSAVAAWAAFLAARLPTSHQYFSTRLADDLVVVADEVFVDLTVEFTELSARVQLRTDVKEVAQGPFYSEYLPPATLLVTWHRARSAADVASLARVFDGALWNIGADESIGKGLVWSTIQAPAVAAAAS